ncbi:MAG: hypothetical protein E6J01_09950 [Chloroflexi bacterium]|nr:MAG: hypothetical protein E6J01_09950 [Chloroflexota bacterium]
MGAGSRRLIRPAALLGALLAGTLVFAGAELLNSDTAGPWLELAASALLGLTLLTGTLFIRAALVRRRERIPRRAWGWVAAAAGSALVGLAAVLFLATSFQVGSTLTGADVRETRPILDGLPVPPRARLVSEHPGLAGSESIVADYRVPDLSQVASFYTQALPKRGWSSEDANPGAALLRYRKGDFVVIVLIDQSGTPATDFTVTVDHAPTPSVSPSTSAG